MCGEWDTLLSGHFVQKGFLIRPVNIIRESDDGIVSIPERITRHKSDHT
jgi:hypothetical protein